MGLLGWLTGWTTPDPSVLLGCQDWLDEARDRMSEGAFVEADAALTRGLNRIVGLRGKEADHCRAALLCCQGECQFHSGHANQALVHLREAEALTEDDLELCQQVHGNLYETYRYLAPDYPEAREEAARHAERLANILERGGRADLARRYRRQASLVRQGEPPVRVVADVGGQRMEIEEVLEGAEGPMRFFLERNRLMPRAAERLLGQGGQLANQGEYDAALQAYLDATQIDPFAPQPHLRAGLVLLYLGEWAMAHQRLARATAITPHWPVLASLSHLAGECGEGRLSLETVRHWHAIEEAPLPPEGKLNVCEEALHRAPTLPHLHEQRGRLLRERGLGSSAVAAFRRALDLAPPPDVETRACVGLAAVTDSTPECQQLLERAVRLDGDLIAAATARVVLHFG